MCYKLGRHTLKVTFVGMYMYCRKFVEPTGAFNHRRAVAQHCINGDSLSQWGRAKFDPPYRMEIPEPIAKKFGTVDYVRKATPCAKFRANPSTRGFSANA